MSIAININTRIENFSDFNSVEGKILMLFLELLEQLREEYKNTLGSKTKRVSGNKI